MTTSRITVEQAVKKVAKGGSLFTIGTVSGLLLHFISGVITIRYISKSEFGLMSIAYVIVSVLVVISLLGFPNGVPRLLAHALSIKDYAKAKGIVFTSFSLTSTISLSISISLFFIAPLLGSFFSKPELTEVIKIFSVLIPILGISQLIVVIFRGLENVKPKVFFQDIGNFAIKIVFLLVVIWMNWGFKGVLYANIVSSFLILLLLIYYAHSHLPSSISNAKADWLGKELIAFCLPLFGLGLLNMISSWTDTLMLGFFKASNEVGVYNAALKLARLIPIPLQAAVFMYLPIATKLFGEQNFSEIKHLYCSVTKWVFLATLPILLLLTLHSKSIVAFLFGRKYLEAAIIVQLLASGFFCHTILGPNGMTLLALGKTKMLFISALISTFINILLNFALIPKWGAIGAATATICSLVILNIFVSVYLYIGTKIHPFVGNYLKPIVLILVFALLINKLLKIVITHEILLIVLFTLSITCSILPLLFITNSIDEVDMALIKAFQNKLFKSKEIQI